MKADTCVRPKNYVAMARNIAVPQPIGELLYTIGNVMLPYNGRRYTYSFTPPPAANPPTYFTVDAPILSTYHTFMALTKDTYRQVPFPRPSSTEGQPLMLLGKREANGTCIVRSVSMDPTPADAFLFFVHEDPFDALQYPYATSE